MVHTQTVSEADRINLEKGHRAMVLLDNPMFAETINGLSEEYSNAIINTSPQEQEKREHLYYLHRALMDIVASLNDAVRIRHETEVRLQAEESIIDEGNF